MSRGSERGHHGPRGAGASARHCHHYTIERPKKGGSALRGSRPQVGYRFEMIFRDIESLSGFKAAK